MADVVDGVPRGHSLDADIIEATLSEPQDKRAENLAEENDNLRKKNTTLRFVTFECVTHAIRYQVELLSEQISDLQEANRDLKSQNSRMREVSKNIIFILHFDLFIYLSYYLLKN